MHYSISNTAEFGDCLTGQGSLLKNKKEMKKSSKTFNQVILQISFLMIVVKVTMEAAALLKNNREKTKEHSHRIVGKELRSKMKF